MNNKPYGRGQREPQRRSLHVTVPPDLFMHAQLTAVREQYRNLGHLVENALLSYIGEPPEECRNAVDTEGAS